MFPPRTAASDALATRLFQTLRDQQVTNTGRRNSGMVSVLTCNEIDGLPGSSVIATSGARPNGAFRGAVAAITSQERLWRGSTTFRPEQFSAAESMMLPRTLDPDSKFRPNAYTYGVAESERVSEVLMLSRARLMGIAAGSPGVGSREHYRAVLAANQLDPQATVPDYQIIDARHCAEPKAIEFARAQHGRISGMTTFWWGDRPNPNPHEDGTGPEGTFAGPCEVCRASAAWIMLRNPTPLPRTPVPAQRTPVPAQRSPVPAQRSPALMQRSPAPLQRSRSDSGAEVLREQAQVRARRHAAAAPADNAGLPPAAQAQEPDAHGVAAPMDLDQP